MLVNQQALNGIFTGFNTIFNKAFSDAAPVYAKIATEVPSVTGEENYKWLGTIPQMREWIGDRQINNLKASSYTLKNKSYESTVSVSRDDIEDDRIGLYAPAVQSLAQAAALHPDNLVFSLLPGGFANLCYDGVAFFSASHKVGKTIVSNFGTAKLTAVSYLAARGAIMGMKDENDRPLNLVPDVLVVSPALEGKAREILLADIVGGTTNVLKGTAELLVSPLLAGHDEYWYLLCTNKPVKPLLFQNRKAPKFVAMTNETDENVFMRKEYVYGTDSRGNAGYGFWQMAYGSNGTTSP